MLAVKRTAPIEDLYLLNVSDYIKNNVIITDNEQEQRLQLKKICNFIETEIISKLHCTTTKLSHESFDIDSPDFKGPINYLNPSQKEELENVFLQCKEAAIKNIFILITKCIFFGEERIGVNSQTISNTIAHQMWVQILSNLFPSIFYKPAIGDKPLYQQSLIKYKSIVDKLPAIGNSVVWISKQQTYNINGKRIYCPEYVELWMDCFLKALTNPASSRNTLIQSVKLLNLVLDSAKENKEELDRANISAKISVDSFITLIAILKSDDINSEIRQKSPELFDDVSKAYETLKSLLFDQTTNVIQFKESMSSVFQILYFYLLSDPNASNQTFDNTVLDEFSNVIILTLAKYPDVYNEWVKIYKQYQNQPKNIHLTKTIVNKIQNQQNEYLQKGEQLPIENRWRSLDNDAFKKILYEIIFLSEGQDSNPETEEMRKSIKSIIGGGPEEVIETVEIVEPVETEPRSGNVTRSVEIQHPNEYETIIIETIETIETEQPEEHVRTVKTIQTQPEVHVKTIETVENVEPQTEVLNRNAETQPEVNVETIETVENQPQTHTRTVKTVKTIRTVETQQGGSVKTVESQPEVHVETIETVENVEPQTETLDRNAETQPEPEVHVETVETVENVEPQPEVLDRTAEAQPEVNVETIETVENQPGVNVKTIKTIKTIRTVETQQGGSRTIESQPEVHVETIETVENVEPQTETLDRNAETQPEVHIETIETVENIEPQTEVLDRTAEAQPEVNVETIENVENQPGVNVKTIKTIKTIRTVETQQGGSRTIESQPEVHVETIETVEVQPEESNYGVVEEEIETSDRSATEVGEENENNGINVYFEKPYYWGNEIYSYVYKYEDDFTPVFIKEWPGVRIYPIGGEGDIYYYTLDKSYYDGRHRILFSDGSHQVSDVLIEGFDLIRNALYNERGFDRICKTVGENNNVLAFGNYIPIYYKPKEQWLKGPIYAHYRIGNGKWTQAPGQEMTYILNGEEAVLFVKANTNADISVAFTNGEEWDNNYGQNFKVNYINDEPIAATI